MSLVHWFLNPLFGSRSSGPPGPALLYEDLTPIRLEDDSFLLLE
jgi:hypothetical protein